MTSASTRSTHRPHPPGKTVLCAEKRDKEGDVAEHHDAEGNDLQRKLRRKDLERLDDESQRDKQEHQHARDRAAAIPRIEADAARGPRIWPERAEVDRVPREEAEDEVEQSTHDGRQAPRRDGAQVESDRRACRARIPTAEILRRARLTITAVGVMAVGRWRTAALTAGVVTVRVATGWVATGRVGAAWVIRHRILPSSWLSAERNKTAT